MANHGIPNYDRSVYEKVIGGMPIPEYMQWLIDKFDIKNVTKESLNDDLKMYLEIDLIWPDLPVVSLMLTASILATQKT